MLENLDDDPFSMTENSEDGNERDSAKEPSKEIEAETPVEESEPSTDALHETDEISDNDEVSIDENGVVGTGIHLKPGEVNKLVEDYGDDVVFFDEQREIVRGAYNVISVANVKGLEFEKAIVVLSGMTPNEQYVACTRAIQELYVIPS